MKAIIDYRMKDSTHSWMLLAASYLSSVGVWTTSMHLIFKLILAIIAGATSVMALLNQYSTFRTNYGTLWIVVKINKTFACFSRRKPRHRKVNASKRKTHELE